jgi:hypothetical protein
LFDPASPGTSWVVRDAPGDGPGNWAGAPSALYDAERERFYISYRLRRPISEGRGYETRIAESLDGRGFTDVWTAHKEAFDSTSVERSALVKTPEGRYRLYVSFVSRERNRWQIDLLEADSPEHLDPANRQTVLRPEDADSEGVKDPFVLVLGGMYYMYVPYGPRSTVAPGSTEQDLHGTGNVFTTGLVAHSTGLATSLDGVHFQWRGDVLTPGTGWDRNMARLACVVYEPPVYTALYDGRTGRGDVYEDRTGLAVGLAPDRFEALSREGPVLQSPHGTGALRYLDVVPVEDAHFFYYEVARSDGAHELRGACV